MERDQNTPGPADLAALTERVAREPMIQALADWSEGHLLVLDGQRRILRASDDLARQLGFEDGRGLLGLRLGDALGCANAASAAGGCGTGRACRFCGALGTVLAARAADGPVESEWRLPRLVGHHVETHRYRLRASLAEVDHHELVLVHLLRAPPSAPEPRDATSSLDLMLSATTSVDADWPTELARYVPIRRLGEGSVGSVWLVEDEDGVPYALKTIRADRTTDPQVLARFEREAELSMKLEHPHIVRTAAVGRTAAGDLFMLSEFCGQGSGTDWLQRMGPLPVDLALYWMTSMAHALGYAWREHQLIHRDIKPDNLLVDGDGMIKLADFGIALRRNPEVARLTGEGLTMGSVHYMAPEQVQGAPDLDVRADLYALGATFYKLLSGLPPLDADDPMALLHRKLGEDPPSIARYRSSLPDGLVAVIDGLLARDRARRPQEPEALSRQLMEIVASEGVDLTRVHRHYHLPDIVPR